MKKVFLFIAVLVLSISCSFSTDSKTNKRTIPDSAISRLAGEYKKLDGFEVIRLGSFPLGIAKTIFKHSKDDDAKDVAMCLDGLKQLVVVDYEDAKAAVRSEFDGKMESILASYELLLETKDDDDITKIFASFGKDSTTVNSLVIYCPSDGDVVAINGEIPLEQVMKAYVEQAI